MAVAAALAALLPPCLHIWKLAAARGKIFFPQDCTDLNVDDIVSQEYFELLWEYREVVSVGLKFLSDRNKGQGEITFSCTLCKITKSQKLGKNEIDDSVAAGRENQQLWMVLPPCPMAAFLDYMLFDMCKGSMKEQFLRPHVFLEAIETWMKKGIVRPFTNIEDVSHAIFECSSCLFNDRYDFDIELEQVFTDVWYRSCVDLPKPHK